MNAPPAGPPWDDPIERAPLCFVDIEMTGLGPADRMIEICVERVRGGVIEERLHSLIRPDPPAKLRRSVHGIREEELRGAPTFAELCEDILRPLEGAVLVAHGARHDVRFLRRELELLGDRTFDRAHYLDTVELTQRALALGSHRLEHVAEALGIPNPRPHRADNDVAVLRGVFERVVADLKPTSPRDLWHVRVGEAEARPEIIAAAQQAANRRSPVSVRYRPSRRGATTLSFVVTSVITNLDPPRVLGYLHDSRGRRELRADRILSIEPLEPR